MRGTRLLGAYEITLPFGGITRIRFNGSDLNQDFSRYPRFFPYANILFFLHKFHFVETFPVFPRQIYLLSLWIIGDPVQHICVLIPQMPWKEP